MFRRDRPAVPMKHATPDLMPGVARTGERGREQTRQLQRNVLSFLGTLVYALSGVLPQLPPHDGIGIRPDISSADVVDIIGRVGRGAHTSPALILAGIPIAGVRRRIIWARLLLHSLRECRRCQHGSQRHSGDSHFHDVSFLPSLMWTNARA